MRYKVVISTILFSQIVHAISHSRDFLPKFPLDKFRVPRNGIEIISDECLKAGDEYLSLLDDFYESPSNFKEYWALEMLDSGANFPGSGILSDGNLLHHPGSFSGCLNINNKYFSEDDPKAQYCLISYTSDVEAYSPLEPASVTWRFHEHVIPDKATLARRAGYSLIETRDSEGKYHSECRPLDLSTSPLMTQSYKVGKCLPYECSRDDVEKGATNYLYSLNDSSLADLVNEDITVRGLTLSCHPRDEEKRELTTGDGIMIGVLVFFGLLVVVSTVLDVGVNVMEKRIVSRKLMLVFEGFSAYTNTKKIMKTSSGGGGELGCLNGMRYLSMSWIVLGHVLWEFCNTSNYAVFTSSALATGDGTENIAATVMWNALIGVDTFFVIGGCLLAYHTMKQLDKTKGGNAPMWIMFYVHRYIRLTGVYAVIVGLHATLLKFASGGPQAHFVDACVDKCKRGWWLNLLYINNYAQDIYGPGEADCVNVSWYMAIDMQFFIITPLVLSLIWRFPRVGYSLVAIIIAAGTACQITFTILDDEYFHGGFSYYIKPYNRCHPYFIGLLLGLFLHKRRDQPKLPINWLLTTLIWAIAGATASAVVYGIAPYNLLKDAEVAVPCTDKHPSMVDRVMFNGFAKIAWALSIAWLILACVKKRGGPINTVLCWPIWQPLARVQYCLYLLHRTVIYLVNSRTETLQRFSGMILTQQFISILAISTALAFLFVILFEAPIVHMEKLLFAALGVGVDKKPKQTEKQNGDMEAERSKL